MSNAEEQDEIDIESLDVKPGDIVSLNRKVCETLFNYTVEESTALGVFSTNFFVVEIRPDKTTMMTEEHLFEVETALIAEGLKHSLIHKKSN